MDLTPRFFLCARCDRGNIYCSFFCSFTARTNSLREAGVRYQHSIKGRLAHTLRQRRYMQRPRDFKNKLTHQGSCDTTPDGLLPSVAYYVNNQPPRYQRMNIRKMQSINNLY